MIPRAFILAVLGVQRKPFSLESPWGTAHRDIATFCLEELLGTKMRALYQRRKGRDLFDLWLGLTEGGADPHGIVECFRLCRCRTRTRRPAVNMDSA